ncbi:Crp/Fnr family transcriptional regulator [Fibrisoma montanum]|uniref:Crp/Fnr family transcriptional regulator n=2 Tax=Fibrisoma montanum TaxID=2305895 RepID=A0A418MKJ2_9BACT|nr:Crp/Fnr family transcriptional regulator [Fibrisoma montanum]
MQAPSLYDYLFHSSGRNHVRVEKFDKGSYIYQPGDELAQIFLIEKGAVKIGSYSNDGERVIYDVLQPGETFGDLDYLDDHGIEFFEFARAMTSVTLMAIDRDYFKHIVVHDPVASEWFNVAVVRRWWKAETRLLHMTRGDIEARLSVLRKEYDKTITDNAGYRHNLFSLLSHQELADLTGTTRQTISKKLKNNLEPAL